MKKITIDIANWGNTSDQDVLRVVRAAINGSIKYESDRVHNKHHYFTDPDKRVELHIKFE